MTLTIPPSLDKLVSSFLTPDIYQTLRHKGIFVPQFSELVGVVDGDFIGLDSLGGTSTRTDEEMKGEKPRDQIGVTERIIKVRVNRES